MDENLTESTIVCKGCGDETKMSMWAVAQRAMGVEIFYQCPKCKTKTNL